MEQYIKKSAIEAEIKKRRSRNSRNKLNLAAAFEDNYLLSFINTLESKEVDLEKEVEVALKRFLYNLTCKEEYYKFARHFFELGIKAQKGE